MSKKKPILIKFSEDYYITKNSFENMKGYKQYIIPYHKKEKYFELHKIINEIYIVETVAAVILAFLNNNFFIILIPFLTALLKSIILIDEYKDIIQYNFIIDKDELEKDDFGYFINNNHPFVKFVEILENDKVPENNENNFIMHYDGRTFIKKSDLKLIENSDEYKKAKEIYTKIQKSNLAENLFVLFSIESSLLTITYFLTFDFKNLLFLFFLFLIKFLILNKVNNKKNKNDFILDESMIIEKKDYYDITLNKNDFIKYVNKYELEQKQIKLMQEEEQMRLESKKQIEKNKIQLEKYFNNYKIKSDLKVLNHKLQ